MTNYGQSVKLIIMKAFINIITYFFILLFIYAAVSKILDFENFQVQIAQSPLLSAYAGFISYAVIIIEIVISILLAIERTRIIGLYASTALMSSFTVYIFLILNYSDFVPCSCGGILEKLGWTEHLIFNIICVIAGIIAVYLTRSFAYRSFRYITLVLFVTNLFGVVIVVTLFLTSEHIIKKENNFTRRFLLHPIVEKKSKKLDNAYYYFAGKNKNNIILGNRKIPQTLAIIDTSFISTTKKLIRLDNMNLPFKKIELKVHDNYYYLHDGTIPIIFRGKIGDSIAKTISYRDAFFTQLQIIDSLKFALRTQSKATQQFTIAHLNLENNKTEVLIIPNILIKQKDGVFDSDGSLLSDYSTGNIAYMYTYRNQFTIMNSKLQKLKTINTIDTISKAQIEVKQLKNGVHKMTAPALKVNLRTVFHQGLIFNQSNLKGKYEKLSIWKNVNVIDVYDTKEAKYVGSFYIHKKLKKGISDIYASDNNLYVIRDDELIQYQFTYPILKYFKTGGAENLNKE